RVLHRFAGPTDVLRVGSGQGRNDGAPHLPGDGLDRREVTGRSDGEPGLDDVHVQPRELARDLQLFLPVQVDPGRLFTVPQCGIENDNVVGTGVAHGASSLPALLPRPPCGGKGVRWGPVKPGPPVPPGTRPSPARVINIPEIL